MVAVMDSLLRHVVEHLLTLDDAAPPPQRKQLGVPAALRPQAQDCLRYLRDRVGVPRDMGVHAARQFRAHLNHVISLL